MTGPKRRAGKDDEGKALAIYKREGVVGIEMAIIAPHVMDGSTPEDLALAHAMIELYREELADHYERQAARMGEQMTGMRGEYLASAARLRAREPFFTYCPETCV